MRIIIDIQGAQTESRYRGVGRYSLSLAKAIARNAVEHEIWLVLNSALDESILPLREEFRGVVPQERIRVFQAPSSVAERDPKNHERARVAELIREYFLEQFNPDLVLVTSLFEGYIDDAVTSVGVLTKSYKTATVLYDLIPYMNEERYLPSGIQKAYYHRKVHSLQQSDILLAISEASKQECTKSLHIEDERIINISAAVDDIFTPKEISDGEKQSLFAKYGISKKLVMYAPGGFDVRKNFENLIIAYSNLPLNLRNTHQLVVVSKIYDDYRAGLEEIAQNVGLKKDELLITGYVSDQDLVALYRTCTLLVFPSFHEGFGLPVLEAMACGAAVIGSNTTSIPEVIGFEKALFDPKSVDAISDKMREVLEDEALLKELQKHSLKQCKKFSWDKVAKRAIRALEGGASSGKATTKTLGELLEKIVDIDHNFSELDLLNFSRAIDLNTIHNDKVVYIDITQLRMLDHGTGIQRVVKAIITELLESPNKKYKMNLVYLEFNTGNWQYKRAVDFEKKHFELISNDENYIIEPQNGDLFIGLDLMSWVVDAEHQGLFSSWRNRGVEIAFVVYDILPILHPEWWPQNGGSIHTCWLKTIASVSDKLVSISKSVSDEVENWIKQHNISTPKNIEFDYFHLGADVKNAMPSTGLPQDSKFIIEQMQAKPSFLMVGTIEPRKGHTQTLEAFELLWQQAVDINLVLVGKQGWLMDELVKKLRSHPELNKRLFWLEGVSDEFLEQVYSASGCLIAASYGEGFGLPLIEAAKYKIPIIARDIPVFREVAGEHAYYFEDDKNPKTIAITIQNWLELNKQGKHLTSENMSYLTWKQSAEQLMQKLLIAK